MKDGYRQTRSWCAYSGRRKAYDVITSNVVGLSPGTHDEGIVVCDESNDIDALSLQLGQLGNETREMVDSASWGESTYPRAC